MISITRWGFSGSGAWKIAKREKLASFKNLSGETSPASRHLGRAPHDSLKNKDGSALPRRCDGIASNRKQNANRRSVFSFE